MRPVFPVVLGLVFLIGSGGISRAQPIHTGPREVEEARLRQFLQQARALGVPEAQIQAWLRRYRPEAFGRLSVTSGSGSLADTSLVPTQPATQEDTLPEYRQRPPVSVAPEPVDPETGLPYFGYRMFRTGPGREAVFAPVPESSYLLQVGDELQLLLWGDAELRLTLTVDPGGRLLLPRVGPVSVLGLTLREARERVRRALGRVYAGLSRTPPTIGLDLALLRARPIGVFVLGEVERPGFYQLSPGSGVLEALYVCGGPTVRGSLRSVRILRPGQAAREIDLYPVLLQGRPDTTEPLREGDVVFVPVRLSTVVASGAVRRPALYELRPGERLSDLLTMAGGLVPEAHAVRARLERILPPEARPDQGPAGYLLEVSPMRVLSGQEEDLELIDGDRLFVPRAPREPLNAAVVAGAVYFPGPYSLEPGRRTVAAVLEAARLRPDAYRDRAHLYRYVPGRSERALQVLRLGDSEVLGSILLFPRDSLYVFSASEVFDSLTVQIEGAVRRPGRYSWHPGMRVEDLLLLAGGLVPGAAEEVEVAPSVQGSGSGAPSRYRIRLLPEARPVAQLTPIREEEERGDSSRVLRPLDRVFVPYSASFRPGGRVYVGGEVMRPGYYPVTPAGESLAAVLERAGGLRPSAYEPGMRLYRKGVRLSVDPQVPLLDGDSLYVPSAPRAVRVEGDVPASIWIPYQPGRRVSYYLRQAGGVQEGKSLYLEMPDGRMYRVLKKGFLGRGPDPVVPDGSVIRIFPASSPQGGSRIGLAALVAQSIGLVSTILTVILLVRQL